MAAFGYTKFRQFAIGTDFSGGSQPDPRGPTHRVYSPLPEKRNNSWLKNREKYDALRHACGAIFLVLRISTCRFSRFAGAYIENKKLWRRNDEKTHHIPADDVLHGRFIHTNVLGSCGA